MNPYCNATGVGLIPYSTLSGGRLARPVGVETPRTQMAKGSPFETKLSDVDTEIITRVQELAKKKGWAPAQVALAWMDKKVASPIVGIQNVRSLSQISRTYVLSD